MNLRLVLIAKWCVDLIHHAPNDEIKGGLKVIHDAAATVSTDASKIYEAFAAVAGDPFAANVATNAAKALFPSGVPDAHATAPAIPPAPTPPTPAPVEPPAEQPA